MNCFYGRRVCPRSEMEIIFLLLLGLGVIFAGVSESIMEIIKEEFLEKEMKHDMAKSDQEKHTIEVLINLTVSYKNTSLRMSKDLSSSLLTFRRLHYSLSPKRNLGNKYYCNDITVWRKVSEANGSFKLSNNFIHGSVEVVDGVPKAPSCKCGQTSGISCSETPELRTTTCQFTVGKQSPSCQHHGVTSLKKILVVLTSHSLMSWLVSVSNM
ncbi:probable ribonuclease 11 isoform X2 [Ovis aries]|nr:probable ribonuclease 11 isoform X2 [Ovis aries]